MGVEDIKDPSAQTEMKEYCDRIGVTDRYTGFRHNLNRGSRNPVKLGYSWMKNNPPTDTPPTLFRSWALRPSTSPSPTVLKPPPLRRGPSADLLCTNEGHRHAEWSIQERCGINMTFPGCTEYMQRYHKNKRTPGGVKQPVERGYELNPSPNFAGVARRPLAQHQPVRNCSEYQYRYSFPDGNKITKFPWLRK